MCVCLLGETWVQIQSATEAGVSYNAASFILIVLLNFFRFKFQLQTLGCVPKIAQSNWIAKSLAASRIERIKCNPSQQDIPRHSVWPTKEKFIRTKYAIVLRKMRQRETQRIWEKKSVSSSSPLVCMQRVYHFDVKLVNSITYTLATRANDTHTHTYTHSESMLFWTKTGFKRNENCVENATKFHWASRRKRNIIRMERKKTETKQENIHRNLTY